MKKLISALLAMALMLALSPPGHADYDPKVDYLAIMLHAAEVGDIEAGRAASICRNEQIDIELTGETKLDFDELFLLAKKETALLRRLSEEKERYYDLLIRNVHSTMK